MPCGFDSLNFAYYIVLQGLVESKVVVARLIS